MASDIQKLRGDRKMKLSDILKRSIPYLKAEWVRILISLLLIGVSVIAASLLPSVLSDITDSLTPDENGNLVITAFNSVLMLTIGYAAIAIISQGVSFFQSVLLTKAGANIVYNLRMEVFEHIENMSQDQFNQMAVGSLVTRVANYTEAMSNLFTSTLVNLIRNVLTIVVVYCFMLSISWRLSLIILVFAVIIGAFSFFMIRRVGRTFHIERGKISEFNAFLSENLAGMKITQIFNQEKRKYDEFCDKTDTLFKLRMQITTLFAIYRPMIYLVHYLAICSVFGFGIAFSLTAGEIVAFYLYISSFFEPIQNIADQLNHLTRAVTASERLYNLLDVPPDVLDEPDAIAIDEFEGKIEFKNVWFAYDDENWILKDVSFVIQPKEMVAFVGATGAGKTTILSLIVRNYKVQKGEVLIDGINVNHIQIKSLRRLIGQMLQDVFLFSGTIKSNITLRDDSFTEEQINDACTYVNADTFIEKLPLQLEEPVSEGGNNFSQGQRQLLSFARTVLHDPHVLILDEATANIDTETELIIQDSLKKMSSIGTMLVVAHRLSTIQHADKIIVLQNGEIIEQGNHQSLLKQKGYYYRLYQLQLEKSKE